MKLCFYRREALRVRFTVDGKADASEGAGGGGGEASGEAMILCVCVCVCVCVCARVHDGQTLRHVSCELSDCDFKSLFWG